MAKVVQFLEIGNLPKSQLNACPYRKVMIKNLFLSISKSGSARNFHTIFEFSLQISCSHGPPVFRLSHMGKAGSILNLNRDENHMIFKYVFEFRLQICRSQDPPVFTLSHMATVVAIILWPQLWPYGTAQRQGGLESGKSANEIRSRLPFENTHLSMKIHIYEATRSPIWDSRKTGGP